MISAAKIVIILYGSKHFSLASLAGKQLFGHFNYLLYLCSGYEIVRSRLGR